MTELKKWINKDGGEAFPPDEISEEYLRSIGYFPEGEIQEIESTEKEEVSVRKYRVLAPFQYEGEKYDKGDEVELPTEEALKREEKVEEITE